MNINERFYDKKGIRYEKWSNKEASSQEKEIIKKTTFMPDKDIERDTLITQK